MVKTNPELRAALLAKLDITPQALSLRRKTLNRLVAMPTDIATYVIAHREGIEIKRYLELETIKHVNDFDARLSEKESARSASDGSGVPNRARAQTKPTSAAAKEVVLGSIRVRHESLSGRHVADAEKMARVYPLLYMFENSMREFIDGHLSVVHGVGWWSDDKIVPKGVRQIVERNRNADDTNRYHSGRNARPIYYTNLDDLITIVRSEKGAEVFHRGKLFPRDTWFPELVRKFEVSRNIVAHMNPLTKRDIERLEHAFEDWLGQTKDRPPAATT